MFRIEMLKFRVSEFRILALRDLASTFGGFKMLRRGLSRFWDSILQIFRFKAAKLEI